LRFFLNVDDGNPKSEEVTPDGRKEKEKSCKEKEKSSEEKEKST